MWEDVRAGRIKGVLVYKFDRFASSLIALVNELIEFEKLGVAFISMTQRIDTSTPGGKLMYQVLAAFSEYERTLIIERTKAGLAKAKAQGKLVGRRPRDPSVRER